MKYHDSTIREINNLCALPSAKVVKYTYDRYGVGIMVIIGSDAYYMNNKGRMGTSTQTFLYWSIVRLLEAGMSVNPKLISLLGEEDWRLANSLHK